MATPLPPDPLLDHLWHTYLGAPAAATDTLTTVLAEAVALARGRADDDSAGLAIVATWVAYQGLMTTSGDQVEGWLDELTTAAIVAAGDRLAQQLASGLPG